MFCKYERNLAQPSIIITKIGANERYWSIERKCLSSGALSDIWGYAGANERNCAQLSAILTILVSMCVIYKILQILKELLCIVWIMY